MRRILIAALLLALLGGCSRSSFAGISFALGAAEPELQRLAQSAGSGDKAALLELGIRYEEGRGVAVDLPRAACLYAQAAASTGGTMWVYSPPVGGAKYGSVIPISSGPGISGLAEARDRLRALQDRRRARPDRP